MDIYLNTENLINDIGSKYLMETQSSDPIPPKGTLMQSLNEANAKLTVVLGRFLRSSRRTEADDTLAIEDSYVYILALSPRRAMSKAQPLADAMHSFMVNAVLAKVFSSMAQQELSAKHEAQTAADMQLIDTLLHTKIPPIL